MSGTLLPLDFFARPAVAVARDLLGRHLVSTIGRARCVVRIVETEAYLGVRDAASHAAGGRRTARTEVMFGRPGLAYVYFTYGMHWCFNVVTDAVDHAGAVLVRAGEPLAGLPAMRRRRGEVADRLLAAGPARLAQALGITGGYSGHRLDRPPLLLMEGEPLPARKRGRSVRIGINEANAAAEWPLRFYEKGNPSVSVLR